MLGRISLALAAIAAAGVLAVINFGSSAATPPRLSDAPATQAHLAAVQERHARRAGLAGPAAAAERKRSRTRFANLGRRQALRTARRTFADVVDAPAWRSPVRRTSDRGSDYAALARDQKGRPAVVESTVPLRNDDGAIDLRLEHSGNSFRPRNALVPVSLPASADGTARMPDAELGVQLAGAAPSEATVNADKLFYADAWTDTDAVIVPQPGGMATTFLARSATSPEDFGLDFHLPAGARLRLYGESAGALQPGGAVIEGADGEMLARIAPPLAYDAQGSPVPTQLSADDDRVVVHVAHRDRDLAYPVLIDPAIIRDNFGADYAGTNRWAYWSYAQTQSYTHSISDSYIFVSGLPANTLYTNNSHGTFVYTPPANSYVTQAQTRLIYHAPQSDYFVEGVYSDAIGDMENGRTTGINGVLINGTKAGAYEAATLSGQLRVGQATAPHYNNKVIVGIHMSGNANRNSGMYAQVGGAIVWKSEAKPPTTSFLNGSSDWQNTLAPASVRSTDLGLGSRYVILTVDGVAKPTADRCTSIARHQPCPLIADASFPYGVAEGTHTLEAWSQDLVGNAGAHVTQTVRYDATAPALELGGDLYDGDRKLTGERYTLTVDATDGVVNPTTNAARRSGVDTVRVEMLAEGAEGTVEECENGDLADADFLTLRDFGPNPQSGDNAAMTGLSMKLRPDDYANGTHLLRVTADDRSTNAARKCFEVEVARYVVHGRHVTGDTANGGELIAEEWVVPGTLTARREIATAVTTRAPVPCVDGETDGPLCDETRERSLDSQIVDATTTPDGFVTRRGTSQTDPNLAQISDLLDLAAAPDDPATPTATGDLSTALESWQTAPPWHGATYAMYESDEQITANTGAPDPITGEFPEGTDTLVAVNRVWIDVATKLPLRISQTVGGETTTSYWTYDATAEAVSQKPADFFLLTPPGGAGLKQEATFLGDAPVGELVDTQTETEFVPYDLGPQIAVGGQDLCLVTKTLLQHDEPMPNDGTVDETDPNYRDFSEMTRLDAAYAPIEPGETCQPGTGSLDDAVVTVTSAARSADLSYALRDVVMASGEEQPTPGGGTSAFSGGTLSLAGADDAFVAPSSEGGTLALADVDDSTVLIQGDFTATDAEALFTEMEPS